jgi:outer membrane protein OmpA-like peptidoglycan-associated protein
MNHRIAALSLILPALLVGACAGAPKKDLALEQVRAQLEKLKADPELQGYAPLALGEAERALRQAEAAQGNETQRLHLIYMADRRIQIARTVAQREQLQNEYDRLEAERNNLLVWASQLEAEQARLEAEQARMMSAATAEDAERARQEAAAAREREMQSSRTAQQAREEAQQAKALAESSATAAELAQREAELAVQQAESLRRQLENLQLRQTESGVVVTLGDVLFETGETELVSDAFSSIEEVVDLLQTEPEKKIRIEGHTDSTGSNWALIPRGSPRSGWGRTFPLPATTRKKAGAATAESMSSSSTSRAGDVLPNCHFWGTVF